MMEHRKKGKVHVLLISLIAIILALAIALVWLFISFNGYKKQTTQTIAELTDVEQIVADAVANEEVINMDTFKGYANQYGVSIEFLQRFFNDTVVYRDGEELVYADIDETLPKNSLDFNKNLVRVDGKLQYQEDGVSTAKKGIDISKYQGDIDWNKVKEQGMEYAIIRVGNRGYSEGNIVLDEKFHKNMKNAIAAGIEVGVYFYSQAITVEEAREEAAFVIENTKNYELSYPVVFDSEEVGVDEARTDAVTQAEMTDITIAFCEEIKAAGYHPMVYGNIKWFMARVDMTRLVEYDKWFAQYFNTPFFPYELAMWQYTATGQLDGITGNVDVNLCFKDFGKQEEAPPLSSEAASQ